MIAFPPGVRVWLATGHTDMRKGFPSLALQVQEVLRRDPLGGHLFCFRGRRGDLLKVIWHDGQGACLFTKRLERGRFLWPSPADGTWRSRQRRQCRPRMVPHETFSPDNSSGWLRGLADA
jgi:transposase